MNEAKIILRQIHDQADDILRTLKRHIPISRLTPIAGDTNETFAKRVSLAAEGADISFKYKEGRDFGEPNINDVVSAEFQPALAALVTFVRRLRWYGDELK